MSDLEDFFDTASPEALTRGTIGQIRLILASGPWLHLRVALDEPEPRTVALMVDHDLDASEAERLGTLMRDGAPVFILPRLIDGRLRCLSVDIVEYKG